MKRQKKKQKELAINQSQFWDCSMFTLLTLLLLKWLWPYQEKVKTLNQFKFDLNTQTRANWLSIKILDIAKCNSKGKVKSWQKWLTVWGRKKSMNEMVNCLGWTILFNLKNNSKKNQNFVHQLSRFMETTMF